MQIHRQRATIQTTLAVDVAIKHGHANCVASLVHHCPYRRPWDPFQGAVIRALTFKQYGVLDALLAMEYFDIEESKAYKRINEDDFADYLYCIDEEDEITWKHAVKYLRLRPDVVSKADHAKFVTKNNTISQERPRKRPRDEIGRDWMRTVQEIYEVMLDHHI